MGLVFGVATKILTKVLSNVLTPHFPKLVFFSLIMFSDYLSSFLLSHDVMPFTTHHLISFLLRPSLLYPPFLLLLFSASFSSSLLLYIVQNSLNCSGMLEQILSQEKRFGFWLLFHIYDLLELVPSPLPSLICLLLLNMYAYFSLFSLSLLSSLFGILIYFLPIFVC